jgi:hypothetical protein
MNIFIVKSYGAFEGFTNLKAFNCESKAEEYAVAVKKQIPLHSLANGEEFVEIEEITLEIV